MTTQNSFELTVRKEDLMDLYKDQTTFKLFSKEYAGRIFFIAVASILGIITLIASFYESKYFFYALLFIAGIVYCSYDIWKSYNTKMTKKASIATWADEILHYKSHRLLIQETEVVYKRDNEFFTYPFDRIHIHSAPTYFQILVNDGSELLVPKPAFSGDEHESFVQSITERINNVNEGKTLV